MFLVFHCGITTDHEKPICCQQFHKLLNRVTRPTTARPISPSFSPRESDRWDDWQRQRPHTQPHPETNYNYNYNYAPSPRREEEEYYGSKPFHSSTRHIRPRPSQIIQDPIPMEGAKSFFEEIVSLGD